jgi:hypothetical protein
MHGGTGLLLERHAPDQIGRPPGGRQSPILIGVECPVAIQVAELPSIDAQQW